MISARFQGKPFNIMVIQIYAPTSNTEEAEVEWFYERPTRPFRTNPPKDVLFIIEDWNVKVGSQEIPAVTGKLGLGVQNEAGQRLIVLPKEHTHHSKHPLPTTQEMTLKSLNTSPGADCGSDHELLNAKFRLKLKQVGKTTRPFRYDLNQIPYD